MMLLSSSGTGPGSGSWRLAASGTSGCTARWTGLLFRGQPDANNRIDHAKVSHAGADSGISSYDWLPVYFPVGIVPAARDHVLIGCEAPPVIVTSREPVEKPPPSRRSTPSEAEPLTVR